MNNAQLNYYVLKLNNKISILVEKNGFKFLQHLAKFVHNIFD